MFRVSDEAILSVRRCAVSLACVAPLVACTAPDVSAPLPARIGTTSAELVTDFAVLPAFGTDAPVPAIPFGSQLGAFGQVDAHVIWNGSEYVAVWSDSRAGASGLYATRISRAGVVADPAGVRILPIGSPSIAWNGSEYLVTSIGSSGGADAIRLSPKLEPLDALPVPVMEHTSDCSVASDGTDFLVAATRFDTGGKAVFARRVAADGRVLDDADIQVSDDLFFQSQHFSATYDGTNYVVVIDGVDAITARWVYAVRIASTGVVLDATPKTLTSFDFESTIAYSNTGSLQVVDDGNRHLNRVLVEPGANDTGVPVPLATTANAQTNVSLAANASGYYAVWLDQRSPVTLYGAKIDVGGRVHEPVALSSHATDFLTPADNRIVVAADKEYLVLWHEVSGLLFSRVSPAGVPSTPVRITPGYAYDIHAASDGTSYLVSWAEGGGESEVVKMGVRITPGGVLPWPSPAVGSLAWAGSSYLATVLDQTGTISYVWFAPDGSIKQDAGGLAQGYPNDSFSACHASSCLVAWWDGSRGAVRGMFFTEAGGPQAPFDIAAQGSAGINVAWIGDCFVVTWVVFDAAQPDAATIWARRFLASGREIDATPRQLPTLPDRAIVEGGIYEHTNPGPVIAATGTDGALFAYTAYDPAPSVGSMRAKFRRLIPLQAVGADCDAGIVCSTGSCVHGTCSPRVTADGAPPDGNQGGSSGFRDATTGAGGRPQQGGSENGGQGARDASAIIDTQAGGATHRDDTGRNAGGGSSTHFDAGRLRDRSSGYADGIDAGAPSRANTSGCECRAAGSASSDRSGATGLALVGCAIALGVQRGRRRRQQRSSSA